VHVVAPVREPPGAQPPGQLHDDGAVPGIVGSYATKTRLLFVNLRHFRFARAALRRTGEQVVPGSQVLQSSPDQPPPHVQVPSPVSPSLIDTVRTVEREHDAAV
jgi:hypothetical protein